MGRIIITLHIAKIVQKEGAFLQRNEFFWCNGISRRFFIRIIYLELSFTVWECRADRRSLLPRHNMNTSASLCYVLHEIIVFLRIYRKMSTCKFSIRLWETWQATGDIIVHGPRKTMAVPNGAGIILEIEQYWFFQSYCQTKTEWDSPFD